MKYIIRFQGPPGKEKYRQEYYNHSDWTEEIQKDLVNESGLIWKPTCFFSKHESTCIKITHYSAAYSKSLLYAMNNWYESHHTFGNAQKEISNKVGP